MASRESTQRVGLANRQKLKMTAFIFLAKGKENKSKHNNRPDQQTMRVDMTKRYKHSRRVGQNGHTLEHS